MLDFFHNSDGAAMDSKRTPGHGIMPILTRHRAQGTGANPVRRFTASAVAGAGFTVAVAVESASPVVSAGGVFMAARG